VDDYELAVEPRALLERVAREMGHDGAALDDYALRHLLHLMAGEDPLRSFPFVIEFVELVGPEPDAIGLLEEMLWAADSALVDRLREEAMRGSASLRATVGLVHVGGSADPLWERVQQLQDDLARN